jgi:hypothetical protein
MVLALVDPIIAEVIDAPTRETTVADVIIQALGITGVIIIGALLAGLTLAGLFIWMRRARPDNPFNGTGSERLRLGLDPPRT